MDLPMEQRFERLVERHEALTQSVEILLAAAKEDGENIRALARIAEIHERSLTALENGDDAAK